MTVELDHIKIGMAAMAHAVNDAVASLKALADEIIANKPSHPLDDPADLQGVADQLVAMATALEAASSVPSDPHVDPVVPAA